MPHNIRELRALPNSSWGPSQLPHKSPQMMDHHEVPQLMIEGVPLLPHGEGDGPSIGRGLFDPKPQPPIQMMPGEREAPPSNMFRQPRVYPKGYHTT